MLGLILWVVYMERPDAWAFIGRYEKDNIPIGNLTYFRVRDFPFLME
ncbi:MAG: hypothetical protein HZA49_02790 [Planctomycetes bacterium]|nr:hypothetical protein [Planctomycetota bacterium]